MASGRARLRRSTSLVGSAAALKLIENFFFLKLKLRTYVLRRNELPSVSIIVFASNTRLRSSPSLFFSLAVRQYEVILRFGSSGVSRDFW